ncbi:MAG TPA: inositol monophosphatase family protein [Kineosporiaceae bacterium]|nr:inositol monophosphatase family protein [Kineosporiaceae bacterium]
MVTGDFLPGMELALQQAGTAARLLRGRVANEGKPDPAGSLAGDDLSQAKRTAKTAADELVQELLLLAALRLMPSGSVRLDPEEDTATVERFPPLAGGTGPVLVVDPIDGTLHYVTGQRGYSVCLGLVDRGEMRAAAVYFPDHDDCYGLDESGTAYLAHDFSTRGWAQAVRLAVAPFDGPVIHGNVRVGQPVRDALGRAGFRFTDDHHSSGPDCLLALLRGQSLGYLAHTRHVRDLLLGAVLQGAGAVAVDWSGEPLRWPDGGRLPRAAFLGSAPDARLLNCLREG